MMLRTYMLLLAGLMLATSAWAEPKRDAKDKDAKHAKIVVGSREHQMMLKAALDRVSGGGSLAAELNKNSQVWRSLNADQLRELRQRYYAFLKQNPDKQQALLDAARELSNLTPEQRRAYDERAEWLSRVVQSLTPAQREELRAMSPEDRAKRLLELKAQLPTSAPTQPATQPTTRPTTRPILRPIE